MPVTTRGGRGSSERLYVVAMDWTRRIFQLAIVATALLYAYMLYGMFFGDVGNWESLSHNDRVRILANISGAISYANIAVGVLLITACILFYDEEPFGYSLVAGAVALYYGLPFALDTVFGNLLATWTRSGNRAALSIIAQLKVAAIMMAVPGAVMLVRNLILRIFEGSARNHDDFSAMQYGGAVKEEKPPSKPPIGIMAKCWQLTFCRDAIRKGCPIYHARTKCWKQRVGCMCEENVIRHAMDAIISKELITKDEPVKKDGGLITFDELVEGKPAEKTVELPPRVGPPPSPRNVKIPHNPNLPMSVKIERCKNCVIYNEHQRLKYSFFAPVFTLVIPGIAFYFSSQLSDILNNIFADIDKLIAKLALTGNAATPSLLTGLSSFGFANYLILGSLVVILTTMLLRFLEYCIFRLKL